MEFDEYNPQFSGYRSLMPTRIREILLLSNLYDAFVLEEDGSLSEQIWSQYVGMRLTGPPNVHRVSTVDRALQEVKSGKLDMVIAMLRLGDGDPFAFAEKAKKICPDLPVVFLATDPAELASLPPAEEQKGVDKIFLWNNDPQILLAVIKLMEDRLNVDHDTKYGETRLILLMEDSAAHYSSFLPIMYTVIMKLTRSLIDDGYNDLHKQLRMRSRAKVLLADSYEEGMELYKKYHRYLLGVISDVRYFRNGVLDKDAGFEFVKAIKADSPDLPIMLHSSEPERNRRRAFDIGADFLDKNSSSLLIDFRQFLEERMGFGDFIFRLPNGVEVTHCVDVYDLQDKLQSVPIESLIFHAKLNHISNWLMARTEVTMAEKLRLRKVEDFESHEEVRHHIIDLISEVLDDKQTDVIAEYSTDRSRKGLEFMHLGEGSMGGKGRGIAFVRFLSKRSDLKKEFPGIDVKVPRTLVLGAGEFDHFLADNKLKKFALECDDMKEIRSKFLSGHIRPELYISLRHYLQKENKPIAVRSSSILEDSHLQPFAGLYSTFMLPNNSTSDEERLGQLLDAVKMVWASIYGADPKSYFKATSHRIEEEKMAVVIQEVVGKPHGKYYYPTFSGVGQSYNFYPYGAMKPDEGVAHIAVGLGKMVVDGGVVVRFSPKYPQVLPQFSSPEDWLDHSQRQFYAVKLEKNNIPPWEDKNEGLELLDLDQAEKNGELDSIGSVYSLNDNVIRDSLSYDGPRIATFSGVLKFKEFPLSDTLSKLFAFLSKAMGCPVEIEFAVNLWKAPRKHEFKILQLRPLIANAEHQDVVISDEDTNQAWCKTDNALGNGLTDNIRDIVFVPPEKFDRKYMNEIAMEVGELNSKFVKEDKKYILIGFGRWGSSDQFLGIGVGWSQISNAKVMVEASLKDFRIDPSNGTHFFQNITSLGIGYLTIPYDTKNSEIDWDWLNAQKVIEETRFLKHIQLDEPTIIKINGGDRKAVFVKP